MSHCTIATWLVQRISADWLIITTYKLTTVISLVVLILILCDVSDICCCSNCKTYIINWVLEYMYSYDCLYSKSNRLLLEREREGKRFWTMVRCDCNCIIQLQWCKYKILIVIYTRSLTWRAYLDLLWVTALKYSLKLKKAKLPCVFS